MLEVHKKYTTVVFLVYLVYGLVHRISLGTTVSLLNISFRVRYVTELLLKKQTSERKVHL